MFCELLGYRPQVIVTPETIEELLSVDGFGEIAHLFRSEMLLDQSPLALRAGEYTHGKFCRVRNFAENFQAGQFRHVHVKEDKVCRRKT